MATQPLTQLGCNWILGEEESIVQGYHLEKKHVEMDTGKCFPKRQEASSTIYSICSFCLQGWLFKSRTHKVFMTFGALLNFFWQDPAQVLRAYPWTRTALLCHSTVLRTKMTFPSSFAWSQLGSLQQDHWRRLEIPVLICLELVWLAFIQMCQESVGEGKCLENP